MALVSEGAPPDFSKVVVRSKIYRDQAVGGDLRRIVNKLAAVVFSGLAVAPLTADLHEAVREGGKPAVPAERKVFDPREIKGP